jgi:hypothetical protein
MKNRSDRYIIHPEKQEELMYWASRWGITVGDLTNAIIDTGYLDPIDLKNYFRKKGLLFFSIRRTVRNFATMIRML